jgi:hypothetical protein
MKYLRKYGYIYAIMGPTLYFMFLSIILLSPLYFLYGMIYLLSLVNAILGAIIAKPYNNII